MSQNNEVLIQPFEYIITSFLNQQSILGFFLFSFLPHLQISLYSIFDFELNV